MSNQKLSAKAGQLQRVVPAAVEDSAIQPAVFALQDFFATT
jgi:hypothetical protein